MDLKIVVGAIVAAVLFFFGVMYALASVYAPLRLVIAVPLLAAGFGLVYYLARKHMPALPTRARIVSRFGVGIIGGIVFSLLGAFIFKLITQVLGDYFYLFLIPLGWFGGFGFGVFTKGNAWVRGLFGIVFGLSAMLVGLWLVYTMPFEVYGTSIAPSSVMSFGEFLDPYDYLSILGGMVAAFFAGRR